MTADTSSNGLPMPRIDLTSPVMFGSPKRFKCGSKERERQNEDAKRMHCQRSESMSAMRTKLTTMDTGSHTVVCPSVTNSMQTVHVSSNTHVCERLKELHHSWLCVTCENENAWQGTLINGKQLTQSVIVPIFAGEQISCCTQFKRRYMSGVHCHAQPGRL